jgi:hypothetical protein
VRVVGRYAGRNAAGATVVSDARSDNRNHLLRLYALPVAVLCVILAGVFVAVRRGAGPMPLYWIFGIFVLSYGYVRFARARAARRFTRLLRETTPDPMLAYTRAIFSRGRAPNVELMLANSLAIQRALYGQFGRALDELDLCDWSAAPAMYRASMLQTRALVHYLSRDDVAAGLRAAEEALALANVPRLAPGAERTLRASQLYVDIGRVLCEGATAQLAAELDANAAAATLPFDQAIGWWACALAQASLGNETRVAELRSAIAGLAPHCEPLQRTSVNERAEPGEVSARAVDPTTRAATLGASPRVCAVHPDSIAEVVCVRCGGFACTRCARAVSEAASICAACTERHRELRRRHLAEEGRLRAAGLLAQIGAIGLGTLMTLTMLVTVFVLRREWVLLIGVAFFDAIMAMHWRAGRMVRAFQGNWRSELRSIAVPLLIFIPVGSLLGASLLWQLSRAPFDAEHAAEYQQTVRATPELTPPSPWPLALLASALLCANVVLWFWNLRVLTGER